eukprot:c17205_g2_i1 orf=116-1672(+)
MLGSLVTSHLENTEFDEVHPRFHHGAPFTPLHFALTSSSFTSADTSRCSCSGSSSDLTSSGSTTCRSSCESTISSANAAFKTLTRKPHKAQDLAWLAIHSLRLRGEKISMASLKVLCKLGQGDSGSVYLTQLRGTSCLFALKVVDKEVLMKKNKIHRMHIEREILELVDHPFLPTLYAHFDMGNLSCLLMEFCPGGDLHALMHRQPGNRFALKVVRFYAAQVVVALEYLHMQGIIYRDLKPENVLLRENGHIMLSDFDLCVRSSESKPVELVKLPASSISSRSKRRLLRRYLKIQTPPSNKPVCVARSMWMHSMWSCMRPLKKSRRVDQITKGKKRIKEEATEVMYTEVIVEPTHVRATSMVGTHEYLAPEVVGGWGHGSAVDWWMLGILIYELIFGTTPFKGLNNKHTLHNIAKQQLRFPPGYDVMDMSEACKALIRGLLIKDPSQRLGSARGASEIKQHPFFRGVNWALIRTTKSPSLHHVSSQPLSQPNLHHDFSRNVRSLIDHLHPNAPHFEYF